MSGETEEDPSQEETHSTGDLFAPDALGTSTWQSKMDVQGEVFDDEDTQLALLGTQSDPTPNTDLTHPTSSTAGKWQGRQTSKKAKNILAKNIR